MHKSPGSSFPASASNQPVRGRVQSHGNKETLVTSLFLNSSAQNMTSIYSAYALDSLKCQSVDGDNGQKHFPQPSSTADKAYAMVTSLQQMDSNSTLLEDAVAPHCLSPGTCHSKNDPQYLQKRITMPLCAASLDSLDLVAVEHMIDNAYTTNKCVSAVETQPPNETSSRSFGTPMPGHTAADVAYNPCTHRSSSYQTQPSTNSVRLADGQYGDKGIDCLTQLTKVENDPSKDIEKRDIEQRHESLLPVLNTKKTGSHVDSGAASLSPTTTEDIKLLDNAVGNFNVEHSEISKMDDPNAMQLLDSEETDAQSITDIAEALANVSEMTSTAQNMQRLAARRMEFIRGQVNANPSANTNANTNTHLNVDTIAKGSAKTNASSIADVRTGVAIESAAAGVAERHFIELPDMLTTFEQNENNFVLPPREWLASVLRMGSFNSAPKINNIDSQDDGLEIPKGLSTHELLQHVKDLRGEQQPPLLARYFVKSSLAAQMVPNDFVAGLRYLKLRSVTKVGNTSITSPRHIRLLQWNILSQTLGQNNDGFVRCPEEALKWENRKFLIVEEILQYNPDIICLQEVDHFKFLHNILGTQNYDGIFFPKPDSPCLYIEENNGPDGCAIFFKRDKYQLKHFDTRILEVWRVQSNQVAIAANIQVKATGQEICICTTHLKARHGSLLSKLRNEQGRDLVRFAKQFAEDRPVILCGDFNAEPTEPVYATILNSELFNLSSAYADIKAETEDCSNDERANAEYAVERTKSSIEREPPYTTWKIREDGEECHTIDYVFYSKDGFKVKNCLEFPQGEDIGKDRTPSPQYPSDHFSLLCDFELIDKDPEN